VSETYRERMSVPWWTWPAGLAASAVVVLELTLGAPALRGPVLYAVFAVLVLIGLLALGRIRVAVRDGELFVDDARLPLSFVGEVEVVDAQTRRRLLGVDAQPLAFVVQRPWIAGGVRIDLDDPADPTPYWYVSSRHPAALAEAIRAGRPSGG
jgi:DUF3093 family protein